MFRIEMSDGTVACFPLTRGTNVHIGLRGEPNHRVMLFPTRSGATQFALKNRLGDIAAEEGLSMKIVPETNGEFTITSNKDEPKTLFVSRADHDTMLKLFPDLMGTDWANIRKEWSLSGATLHENPLSESKRISFWKIVVAHSALTVIEKLKAKELKAKELAEAKERTKKALDGLIGRPGDSENRAFRAGH